MAKQDTASVQNTSLAHAVGRRKKAVARAWFSRGSGTVTINGIGVAEYFDTPLCIQNAMTAIKLIPTSGQYDVHVIVTGGGKEGQSDAVKLALSRALLETDETLRPLLKKNGLLTVDSRVKERKKYGQRGARRKFQFVKR